MYSTNNIILLVFLALEFFRIENYVESTESVEYNVYQFSFSNLLKIVFYKIPQNLDN